LPPFSTLNTMPSPPKTNLPSNRPSCTLPRPTHKRSLRERTRIRDPYEYAEA
jgi:hypothetical protein